MKQEAQKATVAHLRTMNALKIDFGMEQKKNNNTSSHMLLDHCYTFGLLL